jgi:hypothetical protein
MNIINRIKGKLIRETFTAAGKIGACNIEDTIVIAGSPRSGTTLLLEALHKLPDYKAINEPLLTPKIQEKTGFHSRSYINLGQNAPQQRQFLDQVLRGQIDSSARWLFESETTLGQIREHAVRKKLLVKFCRINRMLPWFEEQFDVRGILFIVRHPCAVINSMLRYGQWDKWTGDFVQNNLHNRSNALHIDHLPEAAREIFSPIQKRVSTQTQALALMWCLDHYFPLIHAKKHPWILVPYESLTMNNHKELTRITDALNLNLNDEILRVLDQPSSSVKGKVKQNSEIQISKWKQQLKNRQIDDILSIVDTAGLSAIYSDGAEPHYDKLNELQIPAWKW